MVRDILFKTPWQLAGNFGVRNSVMHNRCLDGSVFAYLMCIILIIIIIIRNLYSAIMPLGGYRGAGGTGR